MEQLWGKTVGTVVVESCSLVCVWVVGRWGKVKGGEDRMMSGCDCNVLCTESMAIGRCGLGNLL